MSTISTDSLYQTIDVINEALFFERSLSKTKKERAVKFIASRQGLAGSYRGMFAPTEADFAQGIRLFTGERFATRAGTAHVLGEEACRVLILLDMDVVAAREALARATEAMTAVLWKAVSGYSWRHRPGEYCCGKCTCSLWRHMAVGGLKDADPTRWLNAGTKGLKSLRDGEGRWQRFPYYYTLLALSEIGLPGAVAEMRYAAPRLERLLKRKPKNDAFDERRRVLAGRVLARC